MHQCGSAREGLDELARCAAAQPYDLVLMDWNMPEMDGCSAIGQIRGDIARYGQPRIIMVTAYGANAAMGAVITQALDACLTKPVSRASVWLGT